VLGWLISNLESVQEIIGVLAAVDTKLAAVFLFLDFVDLFFFFFFFLVVWRSAEICGFEGSEECSALH